MNLLLILDFYQKNGLYQSKYDYLDKFNRLMWFAGKSLDIETVHDYCTIRTLQGVKNSTINRELTLARSAINYYNKHKKTTIYNPFNGFSLFEQDFIPRYLNNIECKKLLNACSNYSNPIFFYYVNLLLNTGCRSSELLNLTWQNVNLDERYLVIRNNLSKNRKTLYKPLNYNAISSLKELKNYNNYWVFYNHRTNNRYKTFRRAWLFATDKAKLNGLRIHDLRHTFASLLVKEGVPIYQVSILLGHSDTRITQRYAHLSPNYLTNVVNLLDFR